MERDACFQALVANAGRNIGQTATPGWRSCIDLFVRFDLVAGVTRQHANSALPLSLGRGNLLNEERAECGAACPACAATACSRCLMNRRKSFSSWLGGQWQEPTRRKRLLPGSELSNAGAVAARSNKEQPKLAASESGSKAARWLRRMQVQYQQPVPAMEQRAMGFRTEIGQHTKMDSSPPLQAPLSGFALAPPAPSAECWYSTRSKEEMVKGRLAVDEGQGLGCAGTAALLSHF
ncbi:hypothetical protein HaLaN_06207 [Haematococcus lacustris]|uniref:Uncharacterized protein n=1 Tax=Haematococcus lacustris TaxID=44745 RepID=A0A699YMS1_HAELA|nr:hypothetical protein HaLaN_06207 [Haematococcus lacustris]